MSQKIKDWDELLKDYEARKSRVLAMGGEKVTSQKVRVGSGHGALFSEPHFEYGAVTP